MQVQSKDGFFISDYASVTPGHRVIKKDIEIGLKDDSLAIDGVASFKQKLHIFPLLPQACLVKIGDFVKNTQLANTQESMQERLPGSSEWAHSFLLNAVKEHNKSSQVYTYVYTTIKAIVQNFFENLGEDPCVSSEMLDKKLRMFLHDKIEVQVKASSAELHLSTKDIKYLKKHTHVCLEKLETMLDHVIYRLSYDFIISLPQKALRNFLQADCGSLQFHDHSYLGSLIFIKEASSLLVINAVPVDDYLVSVLKDEGWPGWSLEANKVLAVACRTYLVAKIMKSRALKLPYHIKNSVHHQTYNGQHRKVFEKLRLAVHETHNIFLAHEGQPIDAMFDSCCGGIVPAHVEGYDFKKHPYLARIKACTHCKSAWVYSWQADYDFVSIKKLLEEQGIKVSKVIDMKITKRDKAGLAVQLCIVAPERKILITGRKAYSLFPQVRSFAYSLIKKDKHIIFKGKGYGHHIGLCQWGAMNMVKQGYDYQRVLQFYYPGTTFMKFTYPH